MLGNEQEYVMALFPLLPVLLGAASAGVSAYGKYKSAEADKPFKRQAFKRKAQTGYMRKYMADLQGRSASRARTELAMRPALRAIGAQQRQGQRQLSYQAAQQGLEGSGIEAQKQLALQAGTTQAVAGLGEKVLTKELATARQMQAQKEGQRMKLAGEIGRQEGAVETANRMAEFQTSEANRAAQQQYDQKVAAAKGNILTSAIGGGIKSYMPYAEADFSAALKTKGLLGDPPGGTVSSIASNIPGVLTPPQTTSMYNQSSVSGVNPYSGNVSTPPQGRSQADLSTYPQKVIDGINYYVDPDTGNPIASTGAEGGKVTKDGIAHYKDGGYADILTGLGTGYTDEDELRKKLQAEQDVKLAEHKKQLEIEEEAKKQFYITKAKGLKKTEEANILAGQEFELAEQEREKTRGYEEARQKYETEQFYKTEDERRQTEALKFATKKRTYDIGEQERIAALTEGTTPSQERYTLYRETVMSPEYQQLEDQSKILEKYNLGEKQYANAQKLFEQNQKYGEEFTDKKYKNLEDFIANSKVGKRNWGEGSETKDVKYGTLSKRNKKKLTKKLDKKKLALMKTAGFETGEFEPTGTEEDIQAQITEGEKPTYEFKEGEAPSALPEYKPGVAPTEKEFVQEEYKPKYTAEAPTLQEPTERELYDLRFKETKRQILAGIDVAGNIKKAKGAREEMEFAKLLTDPNADPNQLWQTTYAINNPIETAKMINKMRTSDVQYANKQMVTDVYSGINTALETGDPNAIMAQVSSSDPEYALLLKSDPQKAFTMRKAARIESDKIASSNASDTQLATQMNDAKRGIDTILWAVGDEASGEAIMKVLDRAGNEQSITDAHLEEIRVILDTMSPSASGETNLKVQLDAGEIDKDQYAYRLNILKQIGKDNSGIKKQILSKLNKEKFIRAGEEVPPEVSPPPWNENPTISGN